MLFWIIQQIFISLLLIISIHYIYLFFKNNLTIPKTKDLVKKPLERYRKIYTSMNNQPKESKETMKNELKSYLKQLTKKIQILNKNQQLFKMQANYLIILILLHFKTI